MAKSNLSAAASPSDNQKVEPSPSSSLPEDRASAWTIPLLCAGIAIIACCLLIPAADENRELVYERERLRLDVDQIHKQVAINDEFLHRVADDPVLLQRLAQRQMKLVREGTSVLELSGQNDHADLSPYLLTSLPPPAEMSPYRPVGGVFATLCRHPRPRLFLLGGGLLLMATGLVMGSSKPSD